MISVLLGVSLHEHGVWLELLNELLGSLSEHGGLIHRSDNINFLSIEALSEVQEGGVEAVFSINGGL